MWSRSISAGRSRAGFLLLAAALLATAAPAAAQSVPADTIRYPYIAALSRVTGDDRVYFCGGTLVAPDWILTAAHCFQLRNGARLGFNGVWAEVGAGLLRDVPEEAQVAVARIYVHPRYDGETRRHDIALVRLARPAGPLIADLARTGSPEPATATAIGFGAIYEGRLALTVPQSRRVDPLGSPLRQARLPLIAAAVCAEQLGEPDGQAGARICAGGGPEDVCVGDSGAPLVAEGPRGEDRVIGVASFATGCTGGPMIMTYTSVAAYADWIAETMRQQ